MSDPKTTSQPREQIHHRFCPAVIGCRYMPGTLASEAVDVCKELDELLDFNEEQLLADDAPDFPLPTGVTLPEGMPFTHAAMLQATIDAAWRDYEGDPNNAEEFWNFLTGQQ